MAINTTVENINNQPTIQPRTVTGIFTKYIAKTLPLAFDESMSYYECICALLEYLNETIVPDINNTNAGLFELQNFYLLLQDYVNHYFDNLDVQDEINNKLDEMAESGELLQIFANFMDFVTPEMFGAKGDGITDDTLAWKKMLQYSDHLLIKSSPEKTYIINEKLNISAYQELDLGNATLKTTNSELDFILDIFTDSNRGGILHNVVIDCNNYCGGIYVTYGTVYTIEHVRIINYITNAIQIHQGNIIAKNLILYNYSNNQNSIGMLIEGTDSKIYGVSIRNAKIGIKNMSGMNYFTGVHAWLGSDFSSDDSVAFYCKGQTNLLNCYADTYNTAIINDNSQLVLIDGFKNYINADIYNTIATKAPVFIDFIQSSTSKTDYYQGADKTYLYSFNAIMNSNFTPKFSNSLLNNIMRYLPLKTISHNRSPFELVDYYETAFTFNSSVTSSVNSIKIYDDFIDLKFAVTPTSATISSATAKTGIDIGSLPSIIPNFGYNYGVAPCCNETGSTLKDLVAITLRKDSNGNDIAINFLTNPSAYAIRYSKIISLK